jgi:hypothetical protein
MIVTTDSHTDHVSPQVVQFVLSRFAHRTEFFIETFDLPADLPEVECGLYGPTMGDPPLTEDEVEWRARPGRAYPSRLTNRPSRPTRTVTVIAGPHQGQPCVLYTVFGGPVSPREIDDPTLRQEERDASIAFWRGHALAAPNA